MSDEEAADNFVLEVEHDAREISKGWGTEFEPMSAFEADLVRKSFLLGAHYKESQMREKLLIATKALEDFLRLEVVISGIDSGHPFVHHLTEKCKDIASDALMDMK